MSEFMDLELHIARVLAEAERKLQMTHKDGVPWYDAPRPSRFHRCKTQTSGWPSLFEQIERCACGATRINGRGWFDRNQRRKHREN